MTVNTKPNVPRKFIRKVRAQIRALEKHGYENAEKDFFNKYDKKNRHPNKALPTFSQIIKGNLSYIKMVKGEFDPIYLRLKERLINLDPDLFNYESYSTAPLSQTVIKVFTEGISDALHIRAAHNYFKDKGKFKDLHIIYNEGETEEKSGSSELKTLLESSKKLRMPEDVHFFVFDRDEVKYTTTMKDEGKDYKNHGKKHFSIVLPIPDFRKEEDKICIELLYKDHDIMRFDHNGRRLFLSTEFNPTTGRHKTNMDINCTDRNKFSKKDDGIKIIDTDVYTTSGVNIALPKASFANSILNVVGGFENIDFSGFLPLLELISAIQKGKNTL